MVLRCTGLPSRSALAAPPLRLAALRWRAASSRLQGTLFISSVRGGIDLSLPALSCPWGRWAVTSSIQDAVSLCLGETTLGRRRPRYRPDPDHHPLALCPVGSFSERYHRAESPNHRVRGDANRPFPTRRLADDPVVSWVENRRVRVVGSEVPPDATFNLGSYALVAV
jgi:hypothetical protein